MLNKIIAAIVSTLLIVSFQTSAIAGGCGGGGGYRSASLSKSYAKKQRAQSVAAAKQRQKIQQAKAAKAEAAKVAAAEPAPAKEETKTVAEQTTETTEGGEPLTVAAADETCSKFIPEVGTTVTVDCAIQK